VKNATLNQRAFYKAWIGEAMKEAAGDDK